MLRIRPYKPADAESLISWLKEERMVAYWKADRFAWPVTMEQLELYLRDFEEDRLSLIHIFIMRRWRLPERLYMTSTAPPAALN